MTSALVTGGAGFIGSVVANALIDATYSVTVLDDLSSGEMSRVPHGAEFIHHDVADPDVVAVIRDVRPSIVVHAAAQISVVKSVAAPERDHAVNVTGTEHVVRAAGDSADRFVFISSGGAIYGEADGATEAWPARPVSPYGRNKLAAELVVRDSGLSHAIVRPSNVYGPGQRSDQEGGVVAVFADAVRTGRRAVIYGDGEQARDFVHVDDVMRAILGLIGHERSGTWNVGTGRSVAVHALLETMERVAGRAVGHRHEPERTGEVRSSRLGIGRIADDIGWQPTISLEDGLRTVLETSFAR